MSLIHEVFAWDVGMRAPKKPVFVYLARMAERVAMEANLPVGKIARDVGVSESTVRKCYAQLVQSGYLVHIDQPVGKVHYRLTEHWQVAK